MKKWEEIVKEKFEEPIGALPEDLFAEFCSRVDTAGGSSVNHRKLLWALIPAAAAGLAAILFLGKPSMPEDGIQIIQQPAAPVAIITDVDADADIAGFLEEVHQKQKNHASEEFTVETDGGSLRFLLVSSMPLVQKRHLNGTIVQIDDITDRRNQETLFRRMESLASLTTLAANVAHEIKNPLGSISIHIQLIQKAVKNARLGDGMLPDEKFVENYLNVVNEEIERLNKIVVDFLYAVRPVQAKLAPASLNEMKEF